VLIAMSAAMLLLLALVGMAFDLGRIYIVRNETQLFTDAAALTAAKNLDGTAAGIERAREAVAHLRNRWNLGTESFDGVKLEFSEDARSVRAMAPANQIEITFLQAVGAPAKFTVPARSAAASGPARLIE
jgi:uncharacterized membrane protein